MVMGQVSSNPIVYSFGESLGSHVVGEGNVMLSGRRRSYYLELVRAVSACRAAVP